MLLANSIQETCCTFAETHKNEERCTLPSIHEPYRNIQYIYVIQEGPDTTQVTPKEKGGVVGEDSKQYKQIMLGVISYVVLLLLMLSIST